MNRRSRVPDMIRVPSDNIIVTPTRATLQNYFILMQFKTISSITVVGDTIHVLWGHFTDGWNFSLQIRPINLKAFTSKQPSSTFIENFLLKFIETREEDLSVTDLLIYSRVNNWFIRTLQDQTTNNHDANKSRIMHNLTKQNGILLILDPDYLFNYQHGQQKKT